MEYDWTCPESARRGTSAYYNRSEDKWQKRQRISYIKKMISDSRLTNNKEFKRLTDNIEMNRRIIGNFKTNLRVEYRKKTIYIHFVKYYVINY